MQRDTRQKLSAGRVLNNQPNVCTPIEQKRSLVDLLELMAVFCLVTRRQQLWYLMRIQVQTILDRCNDLKHIRGGRHSWTTLLYFCSTIDYFWIHLKAHVKTKSKKGFEQDAISVNSDSTGYSSAEEEESMPPGGQVIVRMDGGNLISWGWIGALDHPCYRSQIRWWSSPTGCPLSLWGRRMGASRDGWGSFRIENRNLNFKAEISKTWVSSNFPVLADLSLLLLQS